MKKFSAIIGLCLLALLVMGAALDKFSLNVNSTGGILPPYSNLVWSANRPGISNELSTTFTPSNTTYELQAEVTALDAAVDLRLLISDFDTHVALLGTAAYTASTAYATAAQGAKADTALQSSATNGLIRGVGVTGSGGSATTNDGVVTITLTGGGGGSGGKLIGHTNIVFTNKLSSNSVMTNGNYAGAPLFSLGTAAWTNSYTPVTNNSLIVMRTKLVVSSGIFVGMIWDLDATSNPPLDIVVQTTGGNDTFGTVQLLAFYTNTTGNAFRPVLKFGPLIGGQTVYIGRSVTSTLADLFGANGFAGKVDIEERSF